MDSSYKILLSLLLVFTLTTSLYELVGATNCHTNSDPNAPLHGLFKDPLDPNNRQSYYVGKIKCIVCEVDCLADIGSFNREGQNPFQSCPCRYIRYGCLAGTHCVGMRGLTERQFDAAVNMCAANGCVFKGDISRNNNPVARFQQHYSVGKKFFVEYKRACNYNNNAQEARARRNYFNCLKPGNTYQEITGRCSADDLRGQCHESELDKVNERVKTSNEGSAQRFERLRNYAVQVLDIPGPFYTYYYFFSTMRDEYIKNRVVSTSTINFVNKGFGDIPQRFRLRYGYFRITGNEIYSLKRQIATCGAFKTRADAISDLVEKYTSALEKAETQNTCDKKFLNAYFMSQYKNLLAGIGVDVTKYFEGSDQGKNIVYPLLFNSPAGYNVPYYEVQPKKNLASYFNGKGALCPQFIQPPILNGKRCAADHFY